jgi:hypothetical protein
MFHLKNVSSINRKYCEMQKSFLFCYNIFTIFFTPIFIRRKSSMRSFFGFIVLFVATVFICGGCGAGTKLSGLAPVQGVVTLDGSPLAEANVSFSPTQTSGEMRAAAGKTDASGKFTLTTLTANDGVTPGEFIVTVTKFEKFGPAPKKEVNEYGEDITEPHPEKNVLPPKYETIQTSDIKITVASSGDKNVQITLTK